MQDLFVVTKLFTGPRLWKWIERYKPLLNTVSHVTAVACIAQRISVRIINKNIHMPSVPKFMICSWQWICRGAGFTNGW